MRIGYGGSGRHRETFGVVENEVPLPGARRRAGADGNGSPCRASRAARDDGHSGTTSTRARTTGHLSTPCRSLSIERYTSATGTARDGLGQHRSWLNQLIWGATRPSATALGFPRNCSIARKGLGDGAETVDDDSTVIAYLWAGVRGSAPGRCQCRADLGGSGGSGRLGPVLVVFGHRVGCAEDRGA